MSSSRKLESGQQKQLDALKKDSEVAGTKSIVRVLCAFQDQELDDCSILKSQDKQLIEFFASTSLKDLNMLIRRF